MHMAVAASRLEDKTDSVRLVPGRGRRDENDTVTCTAAAAAAVVRSRLW